MQQQKRPEKKEQFKETELGLLPNSWEIVRLNDVSKLVMGQSPPGETYNENGNGMPFLQGKAEFSTIYPRHIKFTTKPLKIATKDSVLISVRAPVGDVNIANIDYCIGRGLASISLNNGENRFLFYLLTYFKPEIEKEGTGSTFKAINKTKLQNFLIPYPLPIEQHKITYVLSTIQTAQENTDKVITALRELKKAMMKHLFMYGRVNLDETKNVEVLETGVGVIPESWNVRSLVELVEKTKQTDMRKNNNEFKYIDVSGIDRNSLKIVEYNTFKGHEAPSRARKIAKKDDVIIATVRPTLKRIALVGEEFDNEVCSTAFCVLRAKPQELDFEYMYYAIQRNEFIDNLGRIQRGASYPAVTDSDVKNQKIPVPPVPEQQKIAIFLSTIDKKIDVEKNKKKSLDELFKSMLYNLMTAKTRVNDMVMPNAE
jgi:type I restriction enzyme S subunit